MRRYLVAPSFVSTAKPAMEETTISSNTADKYTYFLEAMKSGVYLRRSWWFSAFAVVTEDQDEWKKEPYPYRLVQTMTGTFYVNPENVNELIKIKDTEVGQAPFNHRDKVKLKAGSIENLNEDVEATLGNVIWNYTVLIYPFGSKIQFKTGKQTAKGVEAIILPLLTDVPAEGVARDPKLIYVDEYLKFCDAVFFTTGFTQLFVPAATEKSILPPPGITEFKAKLLEEYKDKLHDPAVAALINAELVKFDAEYLKGDESEGFLISKKSRDTVRRKLFLIYGAEPGLDNKYDVDLVKQSLDEGWDYSKFPQLNNALRAGSWSRGAETAVGGEAVKWLLRATSNIVVAMDDCGTKLGKSVELTPENLKKYKGFFMATPAGPVQLTDENAASVAGKRVMMRTPLFCKGSGTDFCKCCVGERLSLNPTAASSAVVEYGSAFLGIYMSAAHAKTLTLAKLDWKKHFK